MRITRRENSVVCVVEAVIKIADHRLYHTRRNDYIDHLDHRYTQGLHFRCANGVNGHRSDVILVRDLLLPKNLLYAFGLHAARLQDIAGNLVDARVQICQSRVNLTCSNGKLDDLFSSYNLQFLSYRVSQLLQGARIISRNIAVVLKNGLCYYPLLWAVSSVGKQSLARKPDTGFAFSTRSRPRAAQKHSSSSP